MAQSDILKLLEEQYKKINEKEQTLEELWKIAVTRDDILSVLGVSLTSASICLSKLLKREQIIALRSDMDKRKKRYVLRPENMEDYKK